MIVTEQLIEQTLTIEQILRTVDSNFRKLNDKNETKQPNTPDEISQTK